MSINSNNSKYAMCNKLEKENMKLLLKTITDLSYLFLFIIKNAI